MSIGLNVISAESLQYAPFNTVGYSELFLGALCTLYWNSIIVTDSLEKHGGMVVYV